MTMSQLRRNIVYTAQKARLAVQALYTLMSSTQGTLHGRIPHIGDPKWETDMARPDFRKLEAAIHYISAVATQTDIELDPIKLNKVLWYSDSYAYLTRGASITGSRYIRKPYGPVAKYNQIAIENLSRNHFIATGKQNTGGKWEKRVDSISSADTSLFDAFELKIFDAMTKKVGEQMTSKSVSDRTHGEIWELAVDGDDIPLYTVFAECARNPSREKIALAREGLT